jgi:hypothetical protein
MWLEQKVKAIDGDPEAWFGSAVAISGDYAMVGAHNAIVQGRQSQGAVYVFKRMGDHWQQIRKLVAIDGAAGDHFGQTLALHGDFAIINASLATIAGNMWQGAAYVFKRSGDNWVQIQKLVDSHGEAFKTFGTCVAFSKAYALIGSGGASHAGQRIDRAVHVFKYQPNAKLAWVQTQTIPTPLAEDPTSGFGASVAISDAYALIGAPTASTGGNPGQGMVYVAKETGGTWALLDKLGASDAEARANFGVSVAIDGDTALIGAPGATVNGNISQGAAYVLRRSPTGWKEAQKIVAGAGAAINLFGASVSLEKDSVALVGAYAVENYRGAAYVFRNQQGVWSETDTLQASDGASGSVYGYYSTIAGKTALVGSYTATVDGETKRGAAYFHTYQEPLATTPSIGRGG